MSETDSLLTVAIMSYNRPDYLRNCVDSVHRHLPGARILVMDDASDDPVQQAELRRAAADRQRVAHSALAGHRCHRLAGV